MDVTEVSILHHVCIVLLGLWMLSKFDWCHPVAYFISLIYLYLVHEGYVTRLRKKVEFDERKQSNQRRVLTDSETVRWLNHAVEKMWPVCMEQIASQKILLPIIPWFLEKYKPWTAKKAVVQHLYLGRNPPMFTEMRVLRQGSDDDHLVLELGMNFLTADDMSAILAVQLRKRLGFGMWAKLHITGMHVEGKVLIGVKFIQGWPFLGRLRVCFAGPPYFQMTVKPIFTHGIDVTEVPGIAGWLDKLLSIAFEQTLVQPNMLVVDVTKFVEPQKESWFSVDVKDPVAHVKVEIIEAADMKPSDLNGLADPYVKGQLGPYRFKTKIQKKTLSPKWLEEFKIPIVTWETVNELKLDVCDKDHIFDDALGNYSINVNEFQDGERQDMWVPLQDVKMGRLHLAITVEQSEKGGPNVQEETMENESSDKNVQEDGNPSIGESAFKNVDGQSSFPTSNQGSFSSRRSFSSRVSEKSPRVADKFDPIDVEGQKETGIWICQPGSEVSQTWEPRKGKSRRIDTEILGDSVAVEASKKDDGPVDENLDGKRGKFKNGLKKLGSMFHRTPKEDQLGIIDEGSVAPSPYINVREAHSNKIGVNLVVDKEGTTSPEGGTAPQSPNQGKVKNFFKQADRTLKNVLSRKDSRRGDSPAVKSKNVSSESDSTDDDSIPPFIYAPGVANTIPITSQPIYSEGLSDSPKPTGIRVSTDLSSQVKETENLNNSSNFRGSGRLDSSLKTTSPDRSSTEESVEKMAGQNA